MKEGAKSEEAYMVGHQLLLEQENVVDFGDWYWYDNLSRSARAE